MGDICDNVNNKNKFKNSKSNSGAAWECSRGDVSSEAEHFIFLN